MADRPPGVLPANEGAKTRDMTETRSATNATPGAVGGAPILEIQDLRTYFFSRDGVAKAVDGVSYSVNRSETLGVVGESGCGKSVTALSILRLIPDPPGRIVGGTIKFNGTDLLTLPAKKMQDIRGNDISMIFQEPMTSLNPVLTIGHQISEAIILHQNLSKRAAMEKAVDMLKLVRISDPARRVKDYPHQMSGGMRQRVMIAMALSCNPKVLIADEPTTALDVTIQAQILDLMMDLQSQLGTAIVLITHSLGVVAETAQRVVVMYAGRKVEEALVAELFASPRHPYTVGLMNSVPRLADAAAATPASLRLTEIPGIVPSLHNLPAGCTFAPRCTYATDQCRTEYPPLLQQRPGHWVACWESDKVAGGRNG
jgi:peptide/nickel transport system ATP-binding protein